MCALHADSARHEGNVAPGRRVCVVLYTQAGEASDPKRMLLHAVRLGEEAN